MRAPPALSKIVILNKPSQNIQGKTNQKKTKWTSFKKAYHRMMPMSLGFSYIVEEPAAHIFGVPHRHEHCAWVTEFKSPLTVQEDIHHSCG